jgi:hypothetical protein
MRKPRSSFELHGTICPFGRAKLHAARRSATEASMTSNGWLQILIDLNE